MQTADPYRVHVLAAIRCGLLVVALVAPRIARAESTIDKWAVALADGQSLIQARTDDVRELRKKTDLLVEQLNEMARSNVVKLKPEIKFEIARKRLYYYTRLGTYNAAIVEIEQTINKRKLPKDAASMAREKLQNMLGRFREELRATVVALNRVARSLKEL